MIAEDHSANIIRELAHETGVSEDNVRKIIAQLGLEKIVKYAKPSSGNLGDGLKISLLSGRYTSDVQQAIESGKERITDEAIEKWEPEFDAEAAFA